MRANNASTNARTAGVVSASNSYGMSDFPVIHAVSQILQFNTRSVSPRERLPREPPLAEHSARGDLERLRENIGQLVTIGITAFRRPDALRRLVASIRSAYPTIPIVIADNGDQPVAFNDPATDTLRLPFDCGVSAARNAIVQRFQTPYLLVTEDDFEFTPETALEQFVDVLEHDSHVGVVGGSLDMHGQRCDFAGDFDVFRNQLEIRQPARFLTTTIHETPYQIVDLVFNFALFRREMLADHLWDEELKICEHLEYFYSVWRAAKWRVAVCRPVCCLHHQVRSDDYNTYRFRDSAQGLTQHWMRTHHLDRLRISRSRLMELDLTGPPNLILFGVGHSGTSVVTQMLTNLGWHGSASNEDLDTEFFELVPVRRLNIAALESGELDTEAALDLLSQLPRPWIIKDPRFVHTMNLWMPVLAKFQPLLLWLVRDTEAVRASYRRRQSHPQAEPTSRGSTVGGLTALSRQIFQAWPWKRLRIDFESITEAVRQFDVARTTAHAPIPLKSVPCSDDSSAVSASVCESG